MHRCRGNIWDYESRPQVMRALGYPLKMSDRIPDITEARNIELGLGLQLAFLHPSKHKFEHPRFCYERLENVGQKIQIADETFRCSWKVSGRETPPNNWGIKQFRFNHQKLMIRVSMWSKLKMFKVMCKLKVICILDQCSKLQMYQHPQLLQVLHLNR